MASVGGRGREPAPPVNSSASLEAQDPSAVSKAAV